MALPWLRAAASDAAKAVWEFDWSAVDPHVARAFAAVFDEHTGELRPEVLVAVVVIAAVGLVTAAGGLGALFGSGEPKGTEPSAAADASEDAANGRRGPANSAGNSHSKPSNSGSRAGDKKGKGKGKGLSMAQLQAAERRIRSAREADPSSHLYWSSFKAKRRPITAAAISACSGAGGPAWVAVAEADLKVRAQLLRRDGSGAAALTRSGDIPPQAGLATAMAIGAVGERAAGSASAAAAASAGAGSSDNPGGLLLVATGDAGSRRCIVVWRLQGSSPSLGPPLAVLDMSSSQPQVIGRLLAPCVPPGSPQSCMAISLAVGQSADTSICVVSPSAPPGQSPGGLAKAVPLTRVDAAQGRNYDMTLSPGRRWAGVATFMSDFRVWQTVNSAPDRSSVAGASMTGMAHAVTLSGREGGHSGRAGGIAFAAPGVSPFLSLVPGAKSPAAGEDAGGMTMQGQALAGPCAGRGDSSRAIAMSANGAWSAWNIDARLDAKQPATLLAKGCVDVSATAQAACGVPVPDAQVVAVRALPGSPLRLVLVLQRKEAKGSARSGAAPDAPAAGPFVAVVSVLASASATADATESLGEIVKAGAGATLAGDAVVLHTADLSGLGTIADVQLADPVSDAGAAGMGLAGVGSHASRGLASFRAGSVAAASGQDSFLLTVHEASMTARTWRFPPVSESLALATT